LWLACGGLALGLANDYQALVIGSVAVSAIVGIGLNVLMGLAGQTSLGHAAFYAIGAYTATILTTRFGWTFALAAVAATLVSGLAGALLSLPALRVRGPYLAMVTIAFGYFVEQGIADWKDVTGGWNGIMNIPHPSVFGTELSGTQVALAALILSALLVPAYAIFSASRWGVVMRATRDAEVAAATMGANLMAVRVLAFSVSAGITGFAGSLFATLNGFISPESFPFFQSISFLLIVMIGGVGHASGPLFGALAVVLLPEALSSLAEYRLMFFGGLLLLVLLLAPNGIVGALSRLGRRKSGATGVSGAAVDTDMQAALAWITRVNQTGGGPLQVQGLSVRFGGNYALSEVTLAVEPGRVTSLIGPNGAGKTTLINVVCGFYAATAGSFSLGAQALGGMAAFRIGRRGIARTFQTSQLFGAMTVLENVRFGLEKGRLFGAAPPAQARQICEGLLAMAGFRGDSAQLANSLPHVDRRLVEVARALATQPALLMLDEPAAGLSPAETEAFSAVLRRIADSGIGVLIIEHDMGLVMGVSDHIHVLDAGRLIASGKPRQIQDDPAVRAAYLGASDFTLEGALPADASAAGDGGDHHAGRQRERIIVTALSAGYGAALALRDASLRVGVGETVAVLGANGAGKSTLMRAIAGLHRPIEGAISLDGQDISNLPAHRIARLGLVMVPEGRQVFPELTVDDNIRIGAHGRGRLTEARLAELYELFPKLKPLKQRRAGLLSGGEQQMLALARGLAAEPIALLLDEPSLGLAPAVVQDLFSSLARLRGEGMTLLLVDQMAGLALALAHRANVLSAGDMVFSGTPAELNASGMLERAYLGQD
jgi:branched-chain amino acid transport system ATP-binding protein